MAEWLVEIRGDVLDLAELQNLFNAPMLNVIKVGDTHFIRSTDFLELTSEDEVRERGLALIDSLNGMARLCIGAFREISEAGVAARDERGNLRTFKFIGFDAILTQPRSSIHPVLSDGTTGPAFSPFQESVPKWITLARQQKAVTDAFHFFRENSWFSLYKVYEIIRDDVGSHNLLEKKRWAPDGDLNRFTGTAQSRAELGDLARHASHKYNPPKNPMTLAEATHLVKQLLLGWLASKK